MKSFFTTTKLLAETFLRKFEQVVFQKIEHEYRDVLLVLELFLHRWVKRDTQQKVPKSVWFVICVFEKQKKKQTMNIRGGCSDKIIKL